MVVEHVTHCPFAFVLRPYFLLDVLVFLLDLRETGVVLALATALLVFPVSLLTEVDDVPRALLAFLNVILVTLPAEFLEEWDSRVVELKR